MKDLAIFITSVLFSLSTVAADEQSELILHGSVDGYETRNYDDKLDFGLVIPTLSKEQILNFSLSSVLSSKTDVIRAAGQRINIPSNVSLPRQSERYFITIRINKPSFRLPVLSDELPETVAVLEGSMPFTDTVDTLRGGSPLFSVINSFTFKSFSLSPITDLEEDLELTAGENAIEGETVTFDVPFETDRDYVAIGLNLNSTMDEAGNSKYFPVNIKTLERPQNLLSIGESSTPVIVTIPKSTFEAGAEEAAGLPFPFSLVWDESQPEFMLPLAKDFVSYERNDEAHGLIVDNSQLLDFKVLAYKATTFDSEGAILTEDTFETMKDMAWSLDIPVSRIRLDVLAVDPDPIVESINNEYMLSEEIFEQAKYITRYEKDVN
ncbi:MAG: hypothetical protein ACRBBP_05260 [Bdellovibrionales bacterium]